MRAGVVVGLLRAPVLLLLVFLVAVAAVLADALVGVVAVVGGLGLLAEGDQAGAEQELGVLLLKQIRDLFAREIL